MLRPLSLIRQSNRFGWRLAALLAVVAQCWVAVAPLSESRGFGLSAHVEAAGTHRGHFTHDEASCSACSVMSMQLLGSNLPPLPVPAVAQLAFLGAFLQSATESPPPTAARPRAPPSVA